MYTRTRRATKMKIIPRGEAVVVLPKDFQNVTTSGLVMSTADNKEFTSGVIVAVGPHSELKVGDKVTFVIGASAYEKAEMVDGEKVFILPNDNIVGVYQ
ncbi:hypothetical protein VPHK356_0025 [Vibrio phage K356]